MTREDAIRRIGLLRAVTVGRGATEAEARVAAEKARRLEARFGVKAHEARVRSAKPRREPVRSPPAGFRGWGRAWSFDPATGLASSNVKVHEYRDKGNWRIEIF